MSRAAPVVVMWDVGGTLVDYALTATELLSRTHEAVYVGNDPENDIAPVRRIGMRAIHFDPRREHEGADAHDVPTLRRLVFQRLGIAPR